MSVHNSVSFNNLKSFLFIYTVFGTRLQVSVMKYINYRKEISLREIND